MSSTLSCKPPQSWEAEYLRVAGCCKDFSRQHPLVALGVHVISVQFGISCLSIGSYYGHTFPYLNFSGTQPVITSLRRFLRSVTQH